MRNQMTRREFGRFAARASALLAATYADGSPAAEKEKAMPTLELKPFAIAIPAGELDDLRTRLAHTRWPDEIPGSAWTYGVDLAWARQMAGYWQSGFDWRKEEARLNSFSQFTTSIDGQNIHFLHIRSPEPNALPLVLTHGWPSSFAEFSEVIGPLSDPRRHGESGPPRDR